METEMHTDVLQNLSPDTIGFVTAERAGYYALKRVIDFVFALILLITLSPLMLLTSILIYIYSPGPIFFIQQRVGSVRQLRNNNIYWIRKNFYCYKFRTMHINADPGIHQAYVKALIENDEEKMAALQGKPENLRKLVNDSRIIRPGKLLRKLSIDELPQLWNVLIGDMSLVGPRPAIPYEVEIYKPWHLKRLMAQPGITGLQQVSARCNIDFDHQVEWDLEYIKNQSSWLDIKIICKTPLAVISTKGAQ